MLERDVDHWYYVAAVSLQTRNYYIPMDFEVNRVTQRILPLSSMYQKNRSKVEAFYTFFTNNYLKICKKMFVRWICEIGN